MRVLMAGAAALALAASGAYAQQKGNGNGNGNGSNKQAVAQGQGNGPKADRREARQERRAEKREERRGNRSDRREEWRDKAQDRMDRRADRLEERSDRYQDRREAFREANGRYDDRDRRTSVLREASRDLGWLLQDRSRSFVEGCPPGLAKKRNGCNPPGQVKDDYRRSLYGLDYRPRLFGLANYDRRGDYYYRDGYLVRYSDRGGISSWIPLLGGALGIGNLWPSGYQSYRVPDYYVDYYDLGGPDRYRYADNVIYRVDPEDAAITSIAALITGDEFAIGEPMPRGYDVYNVPYAYRDRYYDTPEYMYRYSDGYVYQIDPETRLVAAVIDLII